MLQFYRGLYASIGLVKKSTTEVKYVHSLVFQIKAAGSLNPKKAKEAQFTRQQYPFITQTHIIDMTE